MDHVPPANVPPPPPPPPPPQENGGPLLSNAQNDNDGMNHVKAATATAAAAAATAAAAERPTTATTTTRRRRWRQYGFLLGVVVLAAAAAAAALLLAGTWLLGETTSRSKRRRRRRRRGATPMRSEHGSAVQQRLEEEEEEEGWWRQWWPSLSFTQNAAAVSTKTALGLSLLERGDVAGAEATCRQEEEEEEEADLWTLICLGEARLALHDLAWRRQLSLSRRRGSVELQSSSLERLQLAHDDFQRATWMDPTEPRARLGHGMTLLLLATRQPAALSQDDDDDDDAASAGVVVPLETLNVNFLMEATLHLTAAADFMDDNDDTDSSKMKVTALYNAGLAYLAMGAFGEAVHVLQRALDGVEPAAAEASTMVVPTLEATLASALLLLLEETPHAADDDNAATTLWTSLLQQWKNSPSMSLPLDASLIAVLTHNVQRHVALVGENDAQEAKEEEEEDDEGEGEEEEEEMQKEEEEEEEEAEAEEEAMQKEEDEEENGQEVALVAVWNDESARDEDVVGLGMQGEQEEEDKAKAPMDDKDPVLTVLEAALESSPTSCHLWLALAKARLLRGGVALAVEAAATALSLAETAEEKNQAIQMLSQALDQEHHDFGGGGGGKEEEESLSLKQKRQGQEQQDHQDDWQVRQLKMEQDLLSRQVQWLENVVRLGGGGGWTPLQPQPHPQAGYAYADPMWPRDVTSLYDSSHRQRKDNDDDDDDNNDDTTRTKLSQEEKGVPQKNNEEEEEEELLAVGNATTTMMESPAMQEGEEEEEEEEDKDSGDLADVSVDQGDKKSNDTDLSVPTTADNDEEEEDATVQLPELFAPAKEERPELTMLAAGYMKVADAYLNQGQYLLASKQFARVVKSVPHHLAARLGFATALERLQQERFSSPKQAEDVAFAYLNATQVAVRQGEDSLADATLRRALQVTLLSLGSSFKGRRLSVIQELCRFAFTPLLAADLYHVLGVESRKNDDDDDDDDKGTNDWFAVANAFAVQAGLPCHGKSMLEMAKISLSHKEEEEALRQALLAMQVSLDTETQVDALVVAGKANKALGNTTGAMTLFQQALELPATTMAMAQAHHEVALLLLLQHHDGGDHHEEEDLEERVKHHLETALDMGMNVSDEAQRVLGESNPFVLRSIHRAEWLEFQKGRAASSGGGGASGGGGVLRGYSLAQADRSVFAPQQQEAQQRQGEDEEDTDALYRIAQGASTYDGKVPVGGVTGETITFEGTGQKSSASAKVDS